MSPTNPQEFSQIVRSFLKSSQAFSDTDNLMRLGVLDSLRIIELISFLEAQCVVRINPEDITTENFSTIAGMKTLIDRLSHADSH